MRLQKTVYSSSFWGFSCYKPAAWFYLPACSLDRFYWFNQSVHSQECVLNSNILWICYMYPFLCVFAEQHRRSSGAGLWRTHLLPWCLLLQERWRHPIRPRHLAHVRGAGGGSALLRHLEVPLQRSQLRHPPRLVTATPDRALPVPSPSCSRAERGATPSTARWSCNDSRKVYENNDRELFTVF